ncbi:MAG: hypothetical protein E7356_01820 [Clostridiales bacterium]|nr:hypothetical protein [Clostridiales bacterium]
MEKKAKAIKITTVLTCIVIFVCTVVLVFQFIKIGNLRDKTESLQAHKTELIEQINNYDQANAYYNNNRQEYLENYAREVLGWGLDGDTWYTIAQ